MSCFFCERERDESRASSDQALPPPRREMIHKGTGAFRSESLANKHEVDLLQHTHTLLGLQVLVHNRLAIDQGIAKQCAMTCVDLQGTRLLASGDRSAFVHVFCVGM